MIFQATRQFRMCILPRDPITLCQVGCTFLTRLRTYYCAMVAVADTFLVYCDAVGVAGRVMQMLRAL